MSSNNKNADGYSDATDETLTEGDHEEHMNEEDLSDPNCPPPPKNHGPWPGFQAIVDLFENVVKASNKERKKAMLHHFIVEWRKRVGPNIYPALRLVLPESDRDRKRYGLKESKLAKVYIRVLGLAESSAEAKTLANWTKPQEGDNLPGNFSEQLYNIIKSRSSVQHGNLDIETVNETLDKISKETHISELAELFSPLFECTSPLEQKWIVNIITRNMKLGITGKSALYVFHPRAVELYNVCSSLKRVCYTLYDPSIQYQQQIQIGQPFSPMLCHKEVNRLSKLVNTWKKEYITRKFWIEDKLDGNRIQMHYEYNDGSPKFKWYTRQNVDETGSYGASRFRGSLAPIICEHMPFHKDIKELILDGEMMSYSNETQQYLPFTEVRSARRDSDPDAINNVCYIAFDCVYANGVSLVDYKLSERRKALMKFAVKEIPKRFLLHKYVEGFSLDDIITELERIISTGEEGLVIKDPMSKYSIGKRTSAWIKIKPEYLDDYGVCANGVIVGGIYVDGQRRFKDCPFGSYLVALLKDRNGLKANGRGEFVSFVLVGTGLKAVDHEKIMETIPPSKWHDYDPKRPPPGIAFPKSKKNRPDQFVYPHESVLIRVKAAKRSEEADFPSTWTWLYPRFVRILSGPDIEADSVDGGKTWRDADTLADFFQMNEELKKKITAKDFDDAGNEKGRKITTVRKKEYQILDFYRSPDETEIMKKSSLFEGMDFRIISIEGSVQRKYEILVKENGGRFYQDETAGPNMHVIADNLRTFRAAAVKRQGKYDVISPAWIDECIEHNRIVDLRPDLVLYATPETERRFLRRAEKSTSMGSVQKKKEEIKTSSGSETEEDITESDIQSVKNFKDYDEDDELTDNDDNWRYVKSMNIGDAADDDEIKKENEYDFGTKSEEPSHGQMRTREDRSEGLACSVSSDESIDLSVKKVKLEHE